MQSLPDLNRPNLSDTLVATLRELIVDGRLAAGERINEVRLAARLGISRTPLREALGKLVAEGAVTSTPRLGFYVAPLTVDEVEQIYPLRALLDTEALRLAGLPSSDRLANLEALNRDIGDATDSEAVISLDDAWHLALIADCPNPALVALVELFMRRTRRYELALMRDPSNVDRAVADHGDILSALRAHDLERACSALRINMENGKAPIVAWLENRQPTS